MEAYLVVASLDGDLSKRWRLHCSKWQHIFCHESPHFEVQASQDGRMLGRENVMTGECYDGRML